MNFSSLSCVLHAPSSAINMTAVRNREEGSGMHCKVVKGCNVTTSENMLHFMNWFLWKLKMTRL